MNKLKDRKSLEPLDYDIFDYSSHASTYFPENIKINDSLDPNSRWSTISNDHRQFLILKTPISIISNITFGKFSKIHVCNVKEMKISVSFDNLNYIEVFYGGLRNDIEPETFNLKTKINGELIISKFIKIEPLAAWGMNFNYSIWFVSLWGISEVKGILRDQKEKSKVNQVKDCLKTLKSLGYTQEYESLSLKLGEDNPVLSKIKNLIEKEDFEGVEEYVLGLESKYYENFIKENGYVAKWEEVCKKGCDKDKGNIEGGQNGCNKRGNGISRNKNGNTNGAIKPNNWPCERGGHQMVTLDDKIYLYGGWNGLEELGDFWVYEGEEWKCILPDNINNGIMNGIDHIDNPYLSPTPYHNDQNQINQNHIASPGKRSCHKMVTNNSEIYLIGRYISSITRDINPVSNDIWVYKRGWYVLPSKDKNIPPNIYDHYITYGDGVLYCFGGKQTDDDETYGGLYRIEIKEEGGGEGDDEGMDRVDDEDSNDCNDSNHTLPNYNLSPTNSSTNSTPSTSLNNTPSNNTTSLNSSGFFHNPIERWFTLRDDLKQPSNTPQLRGRLGHTMIYIPKNHIPGNIHNNSLVIIGGQRGKENFKHIQFYSIDSDTVYETVHFPIKTEGRIIQRAHLYGEDLIVLFTFGTEKDSKLDTFCLYSYSLIKDKWKLIINEDNNVLPLPRSAHQFVKFKNHFLLFGGNVTDKSDKRQNDMWKLTLKRISIEEVKELLSFKIRKYKVLNLLDKGWKKIAIEFLQMKVKPLVTPKNANEFEKLCGEFFDRQDESELYEEIEKIIK